MTPAPSIVHLVVAADFGERLWNLPIGEPAWIADTTTNHPVVRKIWAERQPYVTYHTGITSFRIAEDKTPEDWLLGILRDVEIHHGEQSQSPPYSILHVVGTPLSPRLRVRLDECGFVRYENSSDGFVAYKLAASRRSQPPLALSVPLSRFTPRVGGGSAR